jgi:hypothetical protein
VTPAPDTIRNGLLENGNSTIWNLYYEVRHTSKQTYLQLISWV